MAADQTELHNKLAGEIVRAIVKPPLEAGGRMSDVLVILESVVMGVVLVAMEEGYDEAIIDSMAEAVKRRIAEQRFKATPAAGHA